MPDAKPWCGRRMGANTKKKLKFFWNVENCQRTPLVFGDSDYFYARRFHPQKKESLKHGRVPANNTLQCMNVIM